MKSIRDKLRNANIKITELSYFLGVSRPTLYHFMDLYMNRDYNSLEKRVYDLFVFIDNENNLTAPILLNYMINNQVSKNVTILDNEDDIIRGLRTLQKSNSDNDKKKFKLIEMIISSSKTDFILDYLFDYINSSKTQSLSGFTKHIKKEKGDK